jgi:hypothetical protein
VFHGKNRAAIARYRQARCVASLAPAGGRKNPDTAVYFRINTWYGVLVMA